MQPCRASLFHPGRARPRSARCGRAASPPRCPRGCRSGSSRGTARSACNPSSDPAAHGQITSRMVRSRRRRRQGCKRRPDRSGLSDPRIISSSAPSPTFHGSTAPRAPAGRSSATAAEPAGSPARTAAIRPTSSVRNATPRAARPTSVAPTSSASFKYRVKLAPPRVDPQHRAHGRALTGALASPQRRVIDPHSCPAPSRRLASSRPRRLRGRATRRHPVARAARHVPPIHATSKASRSPCRAVTTATASRRSAGSSLVPSAVAVSPGSRRTWTSTARTTPSVPNEPVTVWRGRNRPAPGRCAGPFARPLPSLKAAVIPTIWSATVPSGG